ncbi:MAG: peptide ABC transporter substrate-binding protein, partial [Nitrospinaceae bacterium]|nr:peptide ABC transporter substrate-binding protein [Nitrospinaceae bacterium]
MIIKRLLVFLPLIVTFILVQSYFWVPTFSDQVKGSDRRLTQYIQGSIGDAQILNPILHSDTTSGAIVDHVFDGLIDRDKNLRYRGRLASSWKIYEEAYFVPLPGGPSAEEMKEQIQAAVAKGSADWTTNISGVEVIPPSGGDVSIFLPPAKKGAKPKREKVDIRYPPRVKVTLKSVDQDFFTKLK